MNTIQGAIESVSIKDTPSGQKKYGLKILGKWYNGWGNTNYKKDDLVKIEYITTNYGNQIKHIRSPSPILPAPSDTPKVSVEMAGEAKRIPPHSRDATITRLACLHYAALYAQTRENLTEDDVERIARKWIKYANEG